MQQPLLLLKCKPCKLQRFALCLTVCFTVRYTAPCAFHCVSQRRAYFTAAQSLPWQVSNQQRYKIFCWSCKSSTCLREPPELGKKSLQTMDYKSSSQHYETLLQDGLRCRCLIITSNSNSVFSRWASCQKQAHQLGPPRYSLRNMNRGGVLWCPIHALPCKV